jgi:hypothetical protein
MISSSDLEHIQRKNSSKHSNKRLKEFSFNRICRQHRKSVSFQTEEVKKKLNKDKWNLREEIERMRKKIFTVRHTKFFDMFLLFVVNVWMSFSALSLD